ncbi:hypothetical protein [Mucilaginibacter sp.]|uniref:hypothetical protein n=1 Tax=Mucilaginibacter sp. TaxID=1882438 RepID=UPI0032642D4A
MEATSIIEEGFVSIECILFTAFLFWMYNKRKIGAIELILYSVASSTFIISFISNTIAPLFFVTTYFFASEAIALIRGRLLLRLSMLIILFLPFLSSIIISLLVLAGFDVFEGSNPPIARVYYDGFFFYGKFFLPLVFLGTRMFKEGQVKSTEYFFDVVKKVALISCYIGLFQLFLSTATSNSLLLRIFGLRSQYLSYTANDVQAGSARISAFFVEPKTLASFLVFSFPLFLRDKKLIPIAIVLMVGLLTASQTFVIGVIIAIVVFYLFRRIKNIRLNIALVLATILLTVYSISILKQVLFDFYLAHSDNYVVNLVLSRAIERYDVQDLNAADSQVGGLPLQKDSELPVYKFFEDQPWLYLTGYGIKNGGYIPTRYFVYNVEGSRPLGTLTYNLDMRWFYFVCEFGLVIFFTWLCYFTRKFNSPIITSFENKYYAFLIAFLFFNGVELFVIIIYGFYLGRCYFAMQDNLSPGADTVTQLS